MTDYPAWSPGYDLEATVQEIYDHNVDRWLASTLTPPA
jgi:hypothetical protein